MSFSSLSSWVSKQSFASYLKMLGLPLLAVIGIDQGIDEYRIAESKPKTEVLAVRSLTGEEEGITLVTGVTGQGFWETFRIEDTVSCLPNGNRCAHNFIPGEIYIVQIHGSGFLNPREIKGIWEVLTFSPGFSGIVSPADIGESYKRHDVLEI